MDLDLLEFGQGLEAATPRLLTAARHLTGDAEEARDLVQDTLARAWTFRERFTPGTNLGAWLYCILRNQHYSRLRRLMRERGWALDLVGADAAYGPPQEPALTLHEVERAMHALPESLAAALIMVGPEGASYSEAASALGCKVGTLKSRVSRARQYLANAIDAGARESLFRVEP